MEIKRGKKGKMMWNNESSKRNGMRKKKGKMKRRMKGRRGKGLGKE